jgi:predicted Zn-dependent protease
MLEALKDRLKAVIKEYPKLKVQFYLSDWQTDFLRFYKSQTNYNISKNVVSLGVSVYKDQKNYSFDINDPTEETFRERMAEVDAIIDKLPPDPDFHDLEKDKRKGKELPKRNNITIMPLKRKIEILKRFTAAVTPFDFDIYGTFICNYRTTYLVNSNKVDKKLQESPYYFEVKAVSNKNDVTVLECYGGENIGKINTSGLIKSLVNKLKSASNKVVDVEPGDYEVILAPRCIGDFMNYYAGSNLYAASVDRKETDLIGKQGKRVFPSYFTLTDAPQHPGVINSEYGSDGHLIGKLPLFEKGIFRNFLVDNYYGNKLKMEVNGNTGECLVMKTGNSSLEDMIKGVKKGLYISSFHYMNFINPRETSLTGLTRDGTFLIENGKITKVVNNLRFTEKIVDVINNITAIEDRAYTVPSSQNYGVFSIGAFSMPHVRVREFNISSSTKTI